MERAKRRAVRFGKHQPRLRTLWWSSWTYVQGAADDEEFWARKLTPSLFWGPNHATLLRVACSGRPQACKDVVDAVVSGTTLPGGEDTPRIVDEAGGSELKKPTALCRVARSALIWAAPASWASACPDKCASFRCVIDLSSDQAAAKHASVRGAAAKGQLALVATPVCGAKGGNKKTIWEEILPQAFVAVAKCLHDMNHHPSCATSLGGVSTGAGAGGAGGAGAGAGAGASQCETQGTVGSVHDTMAGCVVVADDDTGVGSAAVTALVAGLHYVDSAGLLVPRPTAGPAPPLSKELLRTTYALHVQIPCRSAKLGDMPRRLFKQLSRFFTAQPRPLWEEVWATIRKVGQANDNSQRHDEP